MIVMFCNQILYKGFTWSHIYLRLQKMEDLEFGDTLKIGQKAEQPLHGIS